MTYPAIEDLIATGQAMRVVLKDQLDFATATFDRVYIDPTNMDDIVELRFYTRDSFAPAYGDHALRCHGLCSVKGDSLQNLWTEFRRVFPNREIRELQYTLQVLSAVGDKAEELHSLLIKEQLAAFTTTLKAKYEGLLEGPASA